MPKWKNIYPSPSDDNMKLLIILKQELIKQAEMWHWNEVDNLQETLDVCKS